MPPELTVSVRLTLVATFVVGFVKVAGAVVRWGLRARLIPPMRAAWCCLHLVELLRRTARWGLKVEQG